MAVDGLLLADNWQPDTAGWLAAPAASPPSARAPGLQRGNAGTGRPAGDEDANRLAL